MPEQCVHGWSPWASVGTSVVEWRRDCLFCHEMDVRSSRPDPHEGTWWGLSSGHAKRRRQPA
jgi:hypothetical protein